MNFEEFSLLLSENLQQKQNLQATLSSPDKPELPIRIKIRSIQTKNGISYQIEKYIGQQTFHENLSSSDCLAFLIDQIQNKYKQAIIQMTGVEFHLLRKEGGGCSIKKKHRPTECKPQPHNRSKQTLLTENKPVPCLIELGIMKPDGSIAAGKRDKFKQINRFLEMVADILPALSREHTLQIVDFGCGKSYLTFALYHLLCVMENRNIEILGIDLKEDVIVFCQSLAQKLGYANLRFAVGDINSQNFQQKIDMVVTLHACDTATDAALEKAVRWGADVILSVPCCQHELYNQIKNDSLHPLFKHGILRERVAALVTDAARGQILECLGYQVQILEFIDMEHTPKNLLIRAVKKQQKPVPNKKALNEYKAFKEMLAINPSLEARFSKELDDLSA